MEAIAYSQRLLYKGEVPSVTPPNRVAELRTAQGWRLLDFARRAKIDPRTLKRIEAGDHPRGPRQWIKKRVVLALGIPWSRRGEVFPA